MTDPTLETWARRVADASPTLDPDQQRIAVHTYRRMARTARPVSPEQIAASTGTALAKVDVERTGTVVSLLLPDGGLGVETIQRSCHKVHFFASPESAEVWIAGRPGMFSVSVDDAFELGRITNRLRLGAVFGEVGKSRAG